MFAAAAALVVFLMAAWPVGAANAQAYWGYGVGLYVRVIPKKGKVGRGTITDMGTIKHIALGMSKGLVMHRLA